MPVSLGAPYAIEGDLKMPSATNLFRIGDRYGKSIEWLATGATADLIHRILSMIDHSHGSGLNGYEEAPVKSASPRAKDRSRPNLGGHVR